MTGMPAPYSDEDYAANNVTNLKVGDVVTPTNPKHPKHGKHFEIGYIRHNPERPAWQHPEYSGIFHPRIPAYITVFASPLSAWDDHTLSMAPSGWTLINH